MPNLIWNPGGERQKVAPVAFILVIPSSSLRENEHTRGRRKLITLLQSLDVVKKDGDGISFGIVILP